MDDKLLSLISAFYDAALDQAQWSTALNQLSRMMDSQAATFWVLGGNDTPELTEFSFVNFDPVFIQKYLEQMAVTDPTVQYLVDHPDVPIVHCGAYLSERDIDRSAYYDWHLRHTDARYRLIGQIAPAPGIQAGVTLHRTKKAGRFGSSDLALFNLVYEQLKRALAIAFRLGTLGAAQASMAALLDRNHIALGLLDSRNRIRHMNQKMRKIIEAGDALHVKKSRLTLENHADHLQFERMISVAGASDGSDQGGFMQVPRGPGVRPYLLFASLIPATYYAFSTWQAKICVGIVDPDEESKIPLMRLKLAFDLTDAESRLAELLATGMELRKAAARLGIAYSTARARLADIFEKTGTHRQGELVRLVCLTSSFPQCQRS